MHINTSAVSTTFAAITSPCWRWWRDGCACSLCTHGMPEHIFRLIHFVFLMKLLYMPFAWVAIPYHSIMHVDLCAHPDAQCLMHTYIRWDTTRCGVGVSVRQQRVLTALLSPIAKSMQLFPTVVRMNKLNPKYPLKLSYNIFTLHVFLLC